MFNLDPLKMVPGVSRGPQKVIFWPYSAIGEPNCSIWVEHRFKRVEHCISHMEGPLEPLWTHRKCPPGVSRAPKRLFLAIFVNIWPQAGKAALFGLNNGWTGLNNVSHMGGAICTPLDPSKMVPGVSGGPEKDQFLAIFAAFGCNWVFCWPCQI